MLKWITCLLTFALAQEPPFWKSKDKVYQRIRNGEIIVAVHAVEAPPSQNLNILKVSGGGHVAAPRRVVFKVAQRYGDLPRFSDYIESAKYDRESGVIHMHLAGFGYSTDMDVKVRATDGDALSSLNYQVQSGPLKGLTGRVTMADLPRSKTEVGLEGEFKYKEFPLPNLFLRFGLELAFRRLAWRLRTYAEQEVRSP